MAGVGVVVNGCRNDVGTGHFVALSTRQFCEQQLPLKEIAMLSGMFDVILQVGQFPVILTSGFGFLTRKSFRSFVTYIMPRISRW